MNLTPEQARARANRILAALRPAVSQWTTAVLDQAVLALGGDGQPFGMNDVRLLVPEHECRNAGLYFHGLITRRHPRVLIEVGEEPSINEKAHGKPVKIYRLTNAGRAYIEQRREQRVQQRRAAA